MGVRFAVVTEALDQPPTRIRTLVLWKGDGFSDPVEFDLAGTPCEEVFAGNVLFHPRHLARGFPAFGPRTCIDAESYFGLPLYDSSNRVIGHLAVLDVQEMGERVENLPALRIFASRAAAELERKRVELELKDSNGKLRTIIEGTSDVIYLQDLEGRYLLINPAGAAALDMREDEVVGKADHELFPPEEAAMLRKENDTVARTGEPLINEVAVTLAGETQYFQTNKAPHRNESGSVVGVIGVCRNVTEMKRNAERMRIVERLASLGTFAAGIAHEINNPLAAVMIAAQTAHEANRKSTRGDGGGDGVVDECLESISTAAERAGKIVKSVLKFSRQEASVKEPHALGPIIWRARDLTRAQADLKDTTVEMDVPDELPEVVVNPLEIEQALINVISNAIEATVEATPIKVSVEAFKETVGITVRDQGRGMTREEAIHIFDPFYTARPSAGGTGLGLSVTHAIVRQHGGRIEVESQPDCGTTMIISLPRADQANAAESVVD